MPAYDASFPVGTAVRVVSPVALGQFKATWTHHHSLREEQMQFAGRMAVVVNVYYYHGGSPLYELKDFPDLWHEVCLETT